MHWLSSKLVSSGTGDRGDGVFARAPIRRGELLTMWGGELHTAQALVHMPLRVRVHAIQVHDELFLVPHARLEGADFFNHCCDPNAGLHGQIGLVALRDITPGEQVCYDYAMSDGSAYDEFECHCGAATCRKRIRGSDWMLPQLQQRYRGYFSPYLQQRIEARSCRRLRFP